LPAGIPRRTLKREAAVVLSWFTTLLIGAAILTTPERSALLAPDPTAACTVSTPNEGRDSYGNDALAVSLGWPEGTVVFKPGGPGFVLSNGALSMKFGWTRRLAGQLTIDGHRLDGTSPPLCASIPSGYGDTGFQSTALIFPAPGCWQVTGYLADSALTFVVKVVKIGNGPGAE
jgi:hypothetical protein